VSFPRISENNAQWQDEHQLILHRCGPRKLAKILSICLRRAEEEAQANENRHIEDCEPSATDSKLSTPLEAPSPLSPPGSITPNALEPVSGEADDLVKSMSAAISYPSPPPFDPSTPSLQPLVAPPPTSQPTSAPKTTKLPPIPPTDTLHALLVDDNKINRQLLVMFMRKHQYTYVEAEDGQEALDAYKASCLPGPCSNAPTRRFDVVLMDINMPIMDGMESTRCIREFEKENGLKRSNIIALTGLASAQAQQEAEASGIDVFLPKPVKFAELKKLLTVKPPMEE
jgi:CheY-like chemotaxis protein